MDIGLCLCNDQVGMRTPAEHRAYPILKANRRLSGKPSAVHYGPAFVFQQRRPGAGHAPYGGEGDLHGASAAADLLTEFKIIRRVVS